MLRYAFIVKTHLSPYFVRLLLPAGIAVLYFASRSASAPENLRPYSVQMHLHGSMSEGSGSMRGANVQAKRLGLDVLWWTDHDWRIAYHTYADGYDFEADDLSATRPVPYPAGTDPKLVEGDEMQVDLSPHPANAPVVETVARISAERASQGRSRWRSRPHRRVSRSRTWAPRCPIPTAMAKAAAAAKSVRRRSDRTRASSIPSMPPGGGSSGRWRRM